MLCFFVFIFVIGIYFLQLLTSSCAYLSHVTPEGLVYVRLTNPQDCWIEQELDRLSPIFEVQNIFWITFFVNLFSDKMCIFYLLLSLLTICLLCNFYMHAYIFVHGINMRKRKKVFYNIYLITDFVLGE